MLILFKSEKKIPEVSQGKIKFRYLTDANIMVFHSVMGGKRPRMTPSELFNVPQPHFSQP